MATSSDLEYEFVTPAQDSYCPITTGVLLDPHQTICCGNILSVEAATKIQKEEEPCPFCKKAPFTTYRDQNVGHKVRRMQVYCRNRVVGCEWVGELSTAGSHEETCPRKASPKENDTSQPSHTL